MSVTRRTFLASAAGLLAVPLAGCASGPAAKPSPLDPKKPTSITLWNYYNGEQQSAFDDLVAEFNSTVGADQGIVVTSVSQGTINNLADGLIDSVDGKVGAQALPDLAAVYAETGYIINAADKLAALDEYFTDEDLSAYVPAFVEEGRLVEGGDLKLFPVSKSTECFAANKTDWAAFEAATGTTIDSITSYETLTAAAKAYYDWSGGKALYGTDSVSNYVFVGTKQLGHEMFKVTSSGVDVDLDRTTFRRLWDNYYVPYVKGYFATVASHRSEDMKTGDLLAFTGSTSGASYLPSQVTDANDATHPIEVVIKKPLSFEGVNDIAVQQGASYCILKSDDARQYASAQFLRWLTDSERNLRFSVSSGYSPVVIGANDEAAIRKDIGSDDMTPTKTNMLNALLVASDVYLNNETYTCKPFEGSKQVRGLLTDLLEKTSVADRESVVSQVAAGTSLDDALAPLLSDDYFNTWFESLTKQVNDLVKGA